MKNLKRDGRWVGVSPTRRRNVKYGFTISGDLLSLIPVTVTR